jgi:hypothetical protein
MSISVVTRISNRHVKWVRSSLQNVQRYCQPIEILATVPEDMPFDPGKISRVGIKQHVGYRDRTKMNRPWMDLFDKAQGDWIVNIDDDDIPIAPIVTPFENDCVGIIHGDVITVYVDGSEQIPAGTINMRQSKNIMRPEDANFTLGSYLAIRREAWRSIAPIIDRDCVGYSDYRMTWHLLMAGWRAKHVSRYIQVQRAKPVVPDSFCSEVASATGGWSGVLSQLQANYGHMYGDRK